MLITKLKLAIKILTKSLTSDPTAYLYVRWNTYAQFVLPTKNRFAVCVPVRCPLVTFLTLYHFTD
jgi:hypothetical protein